MSNFWSKQELSFQHVHAFWSYWIGFAFLKTGFPYWFIMGFIAGLIVELYQWLHSTQSDTYLQRKWPDVIRDLCFWTFSCLLNIVHIIL